jgi:hypothetical protein
MRVSLLKNVNLDSRILNYTYEDFSRMNFIDMDTKVRYIPKTMLISPVWETSSGANRRASDDEMVNYRGKFANKYSIEPGQHPVLEVKYVRECYKLTRIYI